MSFKLLNLKPINFQLSKKSISRLTDGHKVLGLVLSAVLYLICMTGTFVVFYMEMERWESPHLPEYTNYEKSAVAKALFDTQKIMAADKNREPIFEDIFLSLPNEKVPRIVAGYNDDARAYNANGEYVGSAAHPNTHFISELHYYLHLPETFGMIIVSVLGIFMLALLIGGALSHKKMFADSFKLRPRSEGHLGRADLHNRIGTWTLPFAFIVTATGSFVGFSQLIVFLVANVFYHGDFAKVMDPMLGSHEETAIITQNIPLKGSEAVVKAFEQLKAKEPNVIPTYIVLKHAVTDAPAIEIIAKKADRLSYGDTYRFDSYGNLKAQNGNFDGEAGKQIYTSLFPLHFGNYGGLPIQFVYFFVGLSICLMINSGMEIWFTKSVARANPRPLMHGAWVGFVYSSITSIAIAMIANFTIIGFDVPIYWGSLAALIAISTILTKLSGSNIALIANIMRTILGISFIALAFAHFIKFNSVNFASLSLNIPILSIGMALVIFGLPKLLKHKQATQII